MSRRQAGSGVGVLLGEGGEAAVTSGGLNFVSFLPPWTPDSFALEVSLQRRTGGRDLWCSRAGPGLPGEARSLSDPRGALSTLHLRVRADGGRWPGCHRLWFSAAQACSGDLRPGRTVARCEGSPRGHAEARLP